MLARPLLPGTGARRALSGGCRAHLACLACGVPALPRPVSGNQVHIRCPKAGSGGLSAPALPLVQRVWEFCGLLTGVLSLRVESTNVETRSDIYKSSSRSSVHSPGGVGRRGCSWV